VSRNEERAQLVKDYLELHGDVSNEELARALGMHLGQARRARNKAR
jgi:transposase-like protein